MIVTLARKINYKFDFEESDMHYDIMEAIDKLDEEISETIYYDEFIDYVVQDYTNLKDIIDAYIVDDNMEIIIKINDGISDEDIINEFNSLFDEILNNTDTSVSVQIEGEVSTSRWNPTTNSGYEESTDYIDSEGYVSIELEDSECKIIKKGESK